METRVKLNVGGTRYETSVSTLTADPHSMLARMVGQEREALMIQEGTEIFIDRNGRTFEYILEVRVSMSCVLNAGKSCAVMPGVQSPLCIPYFRQ